MELWRYSCDAFGHQKPFISGLQEAEGSSVLATSALLASAAERTQRVLDAHQANGSIELTVLEMQRLWAPLCDALGCDASNFWDIHYFSHQQTLRLMELKSPGELRREIRTRLSLNRRVKSFMSEHAEAACEGAPKGFLKGS